MKKSMFRWWEGAIIVLILSICCGVFYLNSSIMDKPAEWIVKTMLNSSKPKTFKEVIPPEKPVDTKRIIMAPGPSEEFNKFLSALKPDTEIILKNAALWERQTMKTNYPFDSGIIRNGFEKLFHSAFDVDSAQAILGEASGCVEYTATYWKNLHKNAGESEAKRFCHDIEDRILILLTAFDTHAELYMEFKSLGSDDPNIKGYIADIERYVQAVEQKVEHFSTTYNGYFDKEAFLRQLNKLRSAKNIQELQFWCELLDRVAFRFSIYDNFYGNNLWRSINEDIKVMQESVRPH